MGIHDVDVTQLILRTAEELKKEPQIKPPVWAPFVKTSIAKERAPTQPDWWFVRAASILRKLFVLGPIGTIKLRTKYGGRKNSAHVIPVGSGTQNMINPTFCNFFPGADALCNAVKDFLA